MLVLSTINGLLSQLVSPTLHTAILLTPQGHLVAYSCDQAPASEDRIRILVGLSSEVWREGIEGTPDNAEDVYDSDGSEETIDVDVDDNEEVGMLECELGRLLVYPIYASSAKPPAENQGTANAKAPAQPVLLLALNAGDEEPWGLMHTKARTLGKYLATPLASVGDRLSPGSSPTKTRNGGMVWGR